MSHRFCIDPDLDKVFVKIRKRDKALWELIEKKMINIIESEDITHYKNLRYTMKEMKRVHIGPFVLVFCYDKEMDTITFKDFTHHDDAY